MTFHFLVWFGFVLSALPAGLFLFNLLLYRRPRARFLQRARISVLIPARNEEDSIEACVRSVLASRDVELEVVVLDDQSADRTSAIVRALAAEDLRVRMIRGPSLPAGWCGKQHACSLLAEAAKFPLLCFLDADVLLKPDCMTAMTGELMQRGTALLSGFPQQQTGTLIERMLIPQMHFILLGFLPIFFMRRSLHPSFSAGCGQLVMLDRAAYRASGGHSSIRTSRHDGIALPRTFRNSGFKTDLCDVTTLASCRMYHSGREVLSGLSKNATEGLAAPARILPFTVVLLGGQVMPLILFAFHPDRLTSASVLLLYLPRMLAVLRFNQPVIGALLHPLDIILLLGIQWVALIRYWLGFPSAWKGRLYTPGAAS